MDFENYSLIAITALVIFFSSGLQAMIGFGNGLIAVPLLLSAGIPLTHAVVLTITTSLCQRLVFGYQMRKHILLRKYLPAIFAVFAGLPLGIYLLGIVSDQSRDIVKQIIGVLILLMVIIKFTVKTNPKENISGIWGALAGFLYGFLGGLANVGGPPLVIWAYAHNWTKEQLRTAPLMISLFAVPFQFFLLFSNFGNSILSVFFLGLLLWPVAITANQIGQKIGRKINLESLRFVVMVSLGGMGAYYILEKMI
jgi:uncharacterized protein